MQGSNHVVWRRERASAFNRARFGRRLFSAQVPRRPFRLWASQRGRQGRLRHGALRVPSVSSSMSIWARSARVVVVVSVRTLKYGHVSPPAAGVPSAQDDGAETGQHLRHEGAQEGVRSVETLTFTMRVYEPHDLTLVHSNLYCVQCTSYYRFTCNSDSSRALT